MYLSWNQKTITDFSDENINSLYHEGYVFTRIGKGVMHQTRSLRIDLSKFELSSENRRILNKTENITLSPFPLPLSSYHWSIGKMAKDFYDTKFGKGVFTANKIKELFTSSDSNFNKLFIYSSPYLAPPRLRQASEGELEGVVDKTKAAGYCIAVETNELLHYSYPFYDLSAQGGPRLQASGQSSSPNLGMGMMLKAILWAKEQNKQYIYLGSAQRPTDVYKLQFEGLEWFDGEKWSGDLEELKKILQQ